MNDKVYNVTFGGVGGQGILKASEIAGWAAMFDGYHVKKSEVHGMAQRGGSVESHLRFGQEVYSSLIPPGGADVLVCFHQEEHKRLKAFLKKKTGVDLMPFLEKANAVIENERYLNTFLVGVLSAKLPIQESAWMQAIEKVFRKDLVPENQKVFLAGRKMGQA